jgi:hypothetical protein
MAGSVLRLSGVYLTNTDAGVCTKSLHLGHRLPVGQFYRGQQWPDDVWPTDWLAK